MNLTTLLTQNTYVLIILALWDLIWKGLALWKSAQKGQKYWFIALLIVNSVGLLPIIYLLIDRYLGRRAQT